MFCIDNQLSLLRTQSRIGDDASGIFPLVPDCMFREIQPRGMKQNMKPVPILCILHACLTANKNNHVHSKRPFLNMLSVYS